MQGSRPGPLLQGVPTLLIDHHQSAAFPDDAQVPADFTCIATCAQLSWPRATSVAAGALSAAASSASQAWWS